MTHTQHIGFIGGGNMARSLIGGLQASSAGEYLISCYEPDPARLATLAHEFNISPALSNQALVDTCAVVVLAVKPQVLKQVAQALRVNNNKIPLFITIAAGIRTTALQRWLGADYAVVRAMPNTPALVRAGATGMYATNNATAEQRQLAESILRAVGLTLWVNEEPQLDAVTALSGSGPAYFFYLMEAIEKAGVRMGLPAETARLLTMETAFGAAKLALEIQEEPAVLRQRVTSPGGTTERAIAVLNENQMSAVVERALLAARDRAVELAEQLEK
jgi:pyrroline-5-carboxylate reductase